MRSLLCRAALAAALFVPAAAHGEWKAEEREESYAITGSTGAELYASIGARGPALRNGGRVIAHTGFKLTWRRDYQRRGDGCVLASAKPRLVITYTLPKPSGRLGPAVKESWRRFIDGVRAHERVHGEMIRDLVRQIEAATVGFSLPDDPGCVRIREALVVRLKALSDAHQQRNSDFDRVEMSDGGNVHRLILNLVNGP